MMEEVDKEKALKQVAEASLNKNTLELNAVEWRATTTERAQDLVEQKAEGLACRANSRRLKLNLPRLRALSSHATKNSLT